MTVAAADIARARKHLGYPAAQPIAGWVGGYPVLSPSAFLFESNIQRLIPASEPELYRLLNILDRIDCALENVSVAGAPAEQVEGVTLNLQEPKWLEERYVYYANRLADLLGCPLCPEAARFQAPRSVGNVRVRR